MQELLTEKSYLIDLSSK